MRDLKGVADAGDATLASIMAAPSGSNRAVRVDTCFSLRRVPMGAPSSFHQGSYTGEAR